MGAQLARLLRGAWREAPDRIDCHDATVEACLHAALDGGCGGLLWTRVASSRPPRALRPLRNAYRHQALDAAVRGAQLAQVVTRLREIDIEPIVLKGWAVARLYRDRAHRPYQDLDLLMPAGSASRAAEGLASDPILRAGVDLHASTQDLPGRSWVDLVAASRAAPLPDGGSVRVLGPEDRLRLAALHFWRHRAERPLWLVDIAVMVECLSSEFDWDRCLTGRRADAFRVQCAVELAVHLLGARTPLGHSAPKPVRLPSWVTDAVYRQWAVDRRVPERARDATAVTLLRQGRVPITRLLRARWPGPLVARPRGNWTDHAPRWPLQVGAYICRAVRASGSLVRAAAQRLHVSFGRGVEGNKSSSVSRTVRPFRSASRAEVDRVLEATGRSQCR